MEISDDAKARLTNRVNRIVADIDVYEAEKKEITRELTSNFYDRSMTRAMARGSKIIEKQDVDAVFADSEDPKEIAAGYMHTYVSSLQRAGILSRGIAYLIDLIIFVLIIGIIVFMIGAPFYFIFPDQFNTRFLDGGDIFVEPEGPIAVLVSFLLGTTVLIGMLVYFIVIEGRFGFTPGKWLLGLRVLREDGTRIGYVEAIIRNIPKVVGNSVFIVIDALLMLLLFNKEKQRGFDKIARTIVVHKSKKEE
ncbi:MAG: RDD family protein [Methanocella sp. PtaU1.Bin125]|nr:MAG: RDD family protein [Methanocella sp. PtaU1.Bin125]